MRRWVSTWTWVWHSGEVRVARGRIHQERGSDGGRVNNGSAPALTESPAARQLRLIELRRAITSGEYQVPADAVAQSVIERMRVNGRATRGEGVRLGPEEPWEQSPDLDDPIS